MVLQFSPNGKWAYFLDNTAKVTIPNTSFTYNTGTTLYVYARAGNGTLATFIGPYALNKAQVRWSSLPTAPIFTLPSPMWRFPAERQASFRSFPSTSKPAYSPAAHLWTSAIRLRNW